MELLWSAAVTGLVIVLGLSLVLRWLGRAGLPVPLGAAAPASDGCIPDRTECVKVFTVTVAFRVLLFLAVGLFACLVLYPGAGPDAALWIWRRWDGLHYINLAELGYSGYVENGKNLFLVFFPLYPWLTRVISWFTGNTMAAGLLLSWLSYAGGCVFFYKLAAYELGRAGARRTVLFLSVYPYAFFFGGLMTEGLFLLTTAAGLWYIRRHRWWLAGLWGVLAALTRMHGVLLIGAACAELVESRGGLDWRAVVRRLPALLLPLLGTLGYLALNWQVTGDPLALTVMQQHWSQGANPIGDTLWYVMENAFTYPDVMVRWQIWIPTLLLFPLCIGLVAWAGKRFRSMYTLYGFFYLVLNYSLSWLLSAGRYLSCALPLFLFAAGLTRGRPKTAIVAASLMALGFVVNLYWFLTGGQIM